MEFERVNIEGMECYKWSMNCPKCGKHLDMATSAFPDVERGPEPGDVTLCVKCGALLELDENMKEREADEERIKAEDPERYAQILAVKRTLLQALLEHEKGL